MLPNTTVGVRYTYRNIGRVLEDVANARWWPTTSGCLACPAWNTSSRTRRAARRSLLASRRSSARKFDDPVHKYQARRGHAEPPVCRTTGRRSRRTGGRACAATSRASIATTTASRIRASRRSTTSPPTIRATPRSACRSSAIAATSGSSATRTAFFRSIGRIRSSSFGNYAFPWLGLGAGRESGSGAPLTPLAANPNYTNGGEIPEAARGSGIQTIDGFKTRTPFQYVWTFRRRTTSGRAAPSS